MQEPNPSAKTPIGWRRAKLAAAGTLALTMGTLGAGLVAVATSAPAFADVTSSAYTIGSTTSAVSPISVTPTTVTGGSGQSFSVTFTATAALSGTTSPAGTISIASSGAGLTAPATSISIFDSDASCIGDSSVQSDSAASFTLLLNSSCSIPVGDKVTVLFTGAPPFAGGTLTFTLTTSQNAAGAAVNVTVNAAPPTVSLTTGLSGLGANPTYTFTSVGASNATGGSWAAFTGAANFIELTASASTIAWYTGGASGYSVTYTPSGGSATSDSISSAVATGSTVFLGLGTAIPAGSTVTITANGENPTTAVSEPIYIIPESIANIADKVGNQETTNPLTFGTSVTGPTVSPGSTLAGATTTYTVAFKADSCFNNSASPCLNAGNTITLSEATGATSFAGVTGVLVTDASSTNSWNAPVGVGSVTVSGTGSDTISIPVPSGDVVNAGDPITVLVAGVVNPSAQTVSDFTVATAGDSVPANASPYAITVSTNTGVVVTVNPVTVATSATYTIANVIANGAIAGGSGQIALVFPTGTVPPSVASDYTITDSTTPAGSGAASSVSKTATTLNGSTPSPVLSGDYVVITVGNSIVSSDKITITVQNVVNPPSYSNAETITVRGAVNGPAVTAPPFPDGNLTYPNGSIVDFSGTDYSFAGGHAFGIPTPTVLTGLQAVDKAAVVTSASGAVVPTSAPAVGTTIVVFNNDTIYVVGTDGELHGFATPAQFTGDGYDPADVITVPNLGGLTVGATAGSVGTGANAFATVASGAIFDSSGTFWIVAGGRAFGIPTEGVLASVTAADTAIPLVETVPSTWATATIATGTLVTFGGGVYVANGGSLYEFKSQAQLATDGYSGTPSIFIPNLGGLTAIGTYLGS